MHKLLFIFGMFLLLGLSSCNGKLAFWKSNGTVEYDTVTIDSADQVMDEISPEATVEYYYNTVVRRYMEDHHPDQMEFIDFYSTDLRQLLTDAAKKERIYNEVGPCDFDIWINSKTFDLLSVKTIDLYSNENDTAVVQVVLRNTGIENTLFIALVKENGLWLVDDFYYPNGDKKVALKPLLQKYMEDGRPIRSNP